MSDLKRIIIHWTAGGHTPNQIDLEAYHFVVSGNGTVVPGKFKPEDNAKILKGRYAAHTLNCNTGSIGVSFAAMIRAQESPFNKGTHPILPAQELAMTKLIAKLCREYDIPVARETVLTHAEVQPTLGIPQKNKWDVTWLPGMTKPGDAIAVGDVLRQRVRNELIADMPATPKPKAQSSLMQFIKGLFS